jgi:hypothetical protein
MTDALAQSVLQWVICGKYVGTELTKFYYRIMGKFRWVANSNDGWDDASTKTFDTEVEAYNDMRDAVFEKMKWNTEHDEDVSEYEEVTYEVSFKPTEIVHKSFSGVYTYKIIED